MTDTISRIRNTVMTAIRGDSDGHHGPLLCLRCAYIRQQLQRIQDDLATIEQAATQHSRRHLQDAASFTARRLEDNS